MAIFKTYQERPMQPSTGSLPTRLGLGRSATQLQRAAIRCLAGCAMVLSSVSAIAVAQEPQLTIAETPIPDGVEVGTIQLIPSTIELNSPIAYAQVLVTSQTPLSEIVDLTRATTYRIEPPIAEIDATGLVRPLQDGQAELIATFGNQQARAAIVISHSGAEFHPSFVRDVQPVLSRLGCNQGTCHGSKDGKGGFKLSLRGYDALYDYRALTDEIGARRFNRVAPDQSLMLLKASGSIPHVGGVLTRPGEPYYEILRGWIADGVPFDLKTSPRVASISVTPELPVLPRAGMQLQMRVLATYTDGAVRDVTRESFVEAGNIEVLSTLPGGRVNTLRRGEAAVLIRYEGAYAATTLTVMGDRTGFEWVQREVYDPIDGLVDQKLQRMKIQAGELCTDADFVRRIYLDLTGLPPTATAVREFLADSRDSRVKREELIDRLVGSPEYVQYWTNKWADLLQVNRKFLGEEGSVALRNWIHDSIAANKPYDQFALEVLTAEGSNVANPPAAYWKVLRDPTAAMENTTHLFLAIRFNCNKCHDHPFERWTQDQYYEMAAYFAQVGRKEDPAYTGQRIGGSAVEGAVPLVEIVYDAQGGEVVHDRTGQQTPPKFPYEHVGLVSTGASRRQMLAQWLTSAENPYFARSYVNRVWGYLTGVGIIEPIDDIRAGNPPTNEPLLNYLEQEFIASGFDFNQLVRKICKSRTYQLSIRSNAWNEDDSINYSHALPRRLPAEVLFDSFHFATGAPFRIPGAPEGIRAAELPDAGVSIPFLDDFGRPVRESACECERSSGVALGPVMKLVNGSSLASAISDPGNDLARLSREIQDDEVLVDELFLRFVARFPTERERLLALETLKAPGTDLEEREAELAEYLQQVGERQAAWEAARQTSVTWLGWQPAQATSDVGATFEQRAEGALRVDGNTGHDTYHFTGPIPVDGLTGLRLEALADPQLPAGGPGRAQNGNFVINEIIVEQFSSERPEERKRIVLRSASADFSQDGWAIAGAIDGNEGTGWAIMPAFNQNHAAIIQFAEPLRAEHGDQIAVHLVQKFSDGKHLLGYLRLSLTDSSGELTGAPLQGPLADALRTPLDQRSAEQQQVIREAMLANDLKYQRLMQAAAQSRKERENPRLVGLQDLAWALVNSPSFLFNR